MKIVYLVENLQVSYGSRQMLAGSDVPDDVFFIILEASNGQYLPSLSNRLIFHQGFTIAEIIIVSGLPG
jgi:hypothetical protein